MLRRWLRALTFAVWCRLNRCARCGWVRMPGGWYAKNPVDWDHIWGYQSERTRQQHRELSCTPVRTH